MASEQRAITAIAEARVPSENSSQTGNLAPTEGKEQPFSLDALKTLVEFTALMAASGYISLRAHFNVFGISATVAPGSERYLMETWIFISALISRYALLLIVIGLLLFLGLVGARDAKTPSTGLVGWVLSKARLWARLAAQRISPLAVPLMISLAGLLWCLYQKARLKYDVAVGPLDFEKIQSIPRGWTVCDVCIAVVIIGYGATLAAPVSLKQHGTLQAMAWGILRLISIVMALQLPIAYGAFVRDPLYPIASVEHGERDSACGLLIPVGSDSITLWYVSSTGEGTTLEIPRDKVNSIYIGRLTSLLDQLNEAAKTPGSKRPVCTYTSTPTPAP